MIALQCILDSLCEHGINIFGDKHSAKDCGGRDGPVVNQMAFDDNDEDFIMSLKQFFYTQLDSENKEIRQTAAQGVSKLLIHCRMYSPELLSKLIIIWFTPNEDQAIIQFIGEFLRLYSLAESQGVIVGQSALEEAFVITLQTIYEENLRINSDNLIKFFLKLIADESHVKLADDLVKRLIESEPNKTKLIEDYLLSAISQLNLIEMESKDLDRFEENIKSVEHKLENSKSKKVKQKLSTIKKNIELRRQHLSADSAFADDFRSVDENNDEDIDVDVRPPDNGDGLRVGSDSDADSFRTCPESPLQKKKKTNDTCDRSEPFVETNTSASNFVSNQDNIPVEDIITNADQLMDVLNQTTDTITDQIESQSEPDPRLYDSSMEID